jgi:hypothetical protein
LFHLRERESERVSMKENTMKDDHNAAEKRISLFFCSAHTLK